MSALAELSIFPLGKGESVSPYVTKVVKIIENAGLPYSLGSMGTTIEGEWEEVMAVTTVCFKELEKECDRIYVNLKIDYRHGKDNRMKEKIRSVQQKM